MGTNLRAFLEKTNGKNFYVMDTETTGFTPDNADVIEISALKVYNDAGNFVLKGQYDSFINPHYPLPEKIVEFNKESGTGICDELLASQPDSDKVVDDLIKFFGKDYNELYVVGHNLDKFDTPFIEKLFETNGKDFVPEGSFDTLRFIQNIEGYRKGIHKLCNIHERTNKAFASGQQYHLSIDDCLATLDVMVYEKEEFEPNFVLEPVVKKPIFNFDFGR